MTAQLQLFEPFDGPVQLPARNPAGMGVVVGALILAGIGAGLGTAAVVHRINRGRLKCAADLPIVGVPLDYHGDWWADRGRRLYWKARHAGETTAVGIARGIIAADVGPQSPCLGQFPPHANTHERNVEFWGHLLSAVHQEMNTERMAV